MVNNRKLVLFIATSLDGYIATEDDSLDWLFKVEGEGDNGYGEFINNVDTILMGRRTYDWVMEMEQGNFPYKDKKCYVFSKSENQNTEYIDFINQDVVKFTKDLKELDGGNIWLVGGGNLIHSFIKERLVDEFIITIAPTLIGKGIPLFNQNEFETELKLISTRRFNQFVELHYLIK